MRSNRRPGRVLRRYAWALVVLAVFVGTFGVGSARWLVAGAGGGLLGIAAILAAAAAVADRPATYFLGTGTVVAVSGAPAATPYGTCVVELVVAARGLSAQTVTVRDEQVPVAKWPEVDGILPVRVGVWWRIRRVQILWDEVPTVDRYPAQTSP
jgi:hypothetical protein